MSNAAPSSRSASRSPPQLYRRAGLPVILCVSHSLGGGVDRHIEMLAERLRGRANLLLLQPSERGAMISAPSLPGHGAATIPAERTGDLVRVLASVGVSRVHVHHVMGLDLDLRAADPRPRACRST